MKKRYVLKVVGLISLCSINADAGIQQKTFELAKSLLSSFGDTLGGGISMENAFTLAMATLRKGFEIHSHITGHNPFAKLNGPLGSDFKKSIQDKYDTHTQTDAFVRTSADLCDQEKAFISKRFPSVQDAFKKLCSRYGISSFSFSSKTMPRVALCASGGGCRAMVATQGFLEAMEKSGLLDLALYIAVLSGSTWATMPRALGVSSEDCFKTYKKYLQFTPDILLSPASSSPSTGVSQEMVLSPDSSAILVSNKASLSNSLSTKQLSNFSQYVQPDKSYLIPRFSPLTDPAPGHNKYDELGEIQRTIMLKFYGKQDITAMDFYGPFLAHILGANFDDPSLQNSNGPSNQFYPQPRQRLFLSQAADYLEQNNYSKFPLPLAAGIAPRKQASLFSKVANFFTPEAFDDLYQWIEYSPYEIGTYWKGSKGAFVPTWAFGRTYEKVPHYITRTVTKTTYEYINPVHGAPAPLKKGGLNPYLIHAHPVSSANSGKIRVPVHHKETSKIPSGFTITSKKNDTTSSYPYISEYPLGNFFATWGSAFAVSPADVARILELDSYTANYPYFGRVFKVLQKGLQFAPYGKAFNKAYNDFRLFPFTTFNFMQFVEDAPCKDNKLTIVDAGIDFNIPIPLLLRPEREVDVIIVLDASAPVFSIDKQGNPRVDALAAAEAWATRNSYPFPTVAGTDEYTTLTTLDANGRTSQDIFIFADTGKPTVIYIPFLDNPANKKNKFKVAHCMGEKCSTSAKYSGCGECNTFNFGYDEKTIEDIRTFMNNIFTTDNIKKILHAIADKSKDKATN